MDRAFLPAVLGIALVVVPWAAGLVGPPGQAAIPTEAGETIVEMPRRTSGTWTETMTDVRVLDFAVYVHEDLGPDDVQIEVRERFEDVPPEDGAQAGICFGLWPRWRQANFKFCGWTGDGTRVFHAEATGQEVSDDELGCHDPLVHCESRTFTVTANLTDIFTSEGLSTSWDEFRDLYDQRYAHVFYVSTGWPSTSVTAEVDYENTTVRATGYGPETTAWGTFQDFDSLAAASAPAWPALGYMHAEGEMSREIGTPGRTTFVTYLPHDISSIQASAHSQGRVTWPDGTQGEAPSFHIVSNQTGTWTFEDESTRHWDQDAAVLWAWETAWTRLPWEDGYDNQADIRVGPG